MTNKERSIEEWEKAVANIAVKSHKLSKNYARFSECIYQGVKEIIQAERQKREEVVERIRKEAYELGRQKAINASVDLKFRDLTQPNNPK